MKYAGMGVSELRRLKQLEDENRRLKRLVADLALDKQMLQHASSKKLSGLLVLAVQKSPAKANDARL